MKVTQFASIAALLSLFLVSMTTAAPFEDIKKRENEPAYLLFNEIDQTLTDFESGEKATSPDYNHLAFKLNVLSTEAATAYDLFTQLAQPQLDPESIESIKEALAKSASKVSAIEQLAIKGNAWFHQKQVVGKISQILELDAFQFYFLFKDLKNRIPKADYSQAGNDLSTIVCSFVNAIETIEPNTFGKNKAAFTYCVNFKAGLRGNFDTDGFDIASITPPGMETCGNSAARFLYAAYEKGTLGSTQTKCTSNAQLIEPSLPSNALGLKE